MRKAAIRFFRQLRLLPSNMYATSDPRKEKCRGKKTDEPLIIRSYQTEYTVCYTDFEVPVLFTTEEAFLSAHDGEYVLPIPEVRYALLEPKLTELADETADGRVFSCYMLECQATASTGERTSTARMSVKIMVAKQPIIFDDPVVEPWK